MSKTNLYLYGSEVDVPEIPNELIVRRIELLNEHLDELLSVNYRERDTDRVKAVVNAVSFWDSINDN